MFNLIFGTNKSDEEIAKQKVEEERIRAEADKQVAKEKAQTERERMEHEARIKEREMEHEEEKERIKVDGQLNMQQEKTEIEKARLRNQRQERRDQQNMEQIKANGQIRIASLQAETDRLKIKYENEQKMREAKEQQYERAHEIKMEQVKAENARQQKEIDAKRERDKQIHVQKLKQMAIDEKEKDKNTKLRQKNESIQRIEAELKQSNTLIEDEIKQLEISKKELEKVSKEKDKNQETIDKFEIYKKQELIKINDTLQLNAAKQDFELTEQQINAAINNTGQHQSDVGRFLVFTHKLVTETIRSTDYSNKLNNTMATFGEVIRRECDDKLKVEDYFHQAPVNLRRLIPIMRQLGYANVESLVCRNENEYDEMIARIEQELYKNEMQCVQNDTYEEKKNGNDAEQLMIDWGLSEFWDKMKDECWTDAEDWKEITDEELEEMGFKRAQIKKFKRKVKTLHITNEHNLLTSQEKGSIKDICMKPDIWRYIQDDKTDAIKNGLMVLSPLMIEFFERIDQGIKKSQQILEMQSQIPLNDQQRIAIQMSEYVVNSEINNNDDEKNAIANYQPNSTVAQQSIVLTNAAIRSVNVTAQMVDKFSENDVTKRALTVAKRIEECCMQIIYSKGMIRECLSLASELLKMKPAYMSNEAKILWSTVDQGIFRIMKSALHMSDVSNKYFNFLTQFQHSFQYFQAHKDKSFFVSLRDVHADCRRFSEFAGNFAERVKKLSDEAMECIGECVAKHIGAENFEKARSERENRLKKWLDKKEIYDTKALDLDHQLDNVQQQKIHISAECARLKYKVSMLETSIKYRQDNNVKYLAAKAVLDKMVI